VLKFAFINMQILCWSFQHCYKLWHISLWSAFCSFTFMSSSFTVLLLVWWFVGLRAEKWCGNRY